MSINIKTVEKKKEWDCPKLYILMAKDTNGGYPPGTPEEMTYEPVIS
jgi:hypothetical protein